MRKLQEKAQDHDIDFVVTFVDHTKAFNTGSRDGCHLEAEIS